MISVMRLLNGVGIAANQLGYDNRIFIAWFGAREDEDVVPMINPVLLDVRGDWVDMKEACLSGAGCVGTIKRRAFAHVKWIDLQGFEQSALFTEWDARIIQHEMDHLNGVCIIDKFNAMDKMANRFEMEKLQIQAGILPDRLRKRGYVVQPRQKP